MSYSYLVKLVRPVFEKFTLVILKWARICLFSVHVINVYLVSLYLYSGDFKNINGMQRSCRFFNHQRRKMSWFIAATSRTIYLLSKFRIWAQMNLNPAEKNSTKIQQKPKPTKAQNWWKQSTSMLTLGETSPIQKQFLFFHFPRFISQNLLESS